MIVKRLSIDSIIFDGYSQSQEDWDYIEDPTFMRSIGSHVCMTCSKFDYLKQAGFGSILYCNFHKKLIYQGHHLTHSCDLYENKSIFDMDIKLKKLPKKV